MKLPPSVQSLSYCQQLVHDCLTIGGIRYAFAYGSGAFQQSGQSAEEMSGNMLDLVLVVSDPVDWHRRNLEQNPGHYSYFRLVGARHLARFQQNYLARCYCNTRIRLPQPYAPRSMKYTVIGQEDLISDLLDWETLYISGRLHKPVLDLVGPWPPTEDSGNGGMTEGNGGPPNTGGQQPEQLARSAMGMMPPRPDSSISGMDLKSALDQNLKSAVHAACLLLPETFSKEQFYTRVAGLSYMGDYRTHIGEDKNKVANLVKTSVDRFDAKYEPILRQIPDYLHVAGDKVEQNLSAAAIFHHMQMLPTYIQWHMQAQWTRRQKKNFDLEDVIFTLARQRDFDMFVEDAIKTIVFASSWRQTAKNVVSAGLWNSVMYGGRKMWKMVKSMMK